MNYIKKSKFRETSLIFVASEDSDVDIQALIEASNFVRNKFRKGEATVAEAVAYLRVAKDIYLKDFILYQPEDTELISREQYPKNFNIAPKDRLNTVHSEEE